MNKKKKARNTYTYNQPIINWLLLLNAVDAIIFSFFVYHVNEIEKQWMDIQAYKYKYIKH